jgi:predicted ATPase
MKINSIEIQGQQVQCENLNVIVGSNGTGKTRLLHELFCKFANINNRDNQSTNYWHPIEFNSTILSEDFDKWYNSLVRREENNRTTYYSPFTQRIGRNNPMNLDETNFKNIEAYKENLGENFSFLQKELSTYLSVDERLQKRNRIQKTNISSPPNDPLNLLFRFPEIVEEINLKLQSILNRKLYISQYDDPQLELIIAPPNCPEAPKFDVSEPQQSYDEFVNWIEENGVSKFDYEGHGVRALANILISYEMPTTDIIFIDEPESHLYPSIKRKFGKIIGNLAKNMSKQIFLVTHDSDLLLGIFDSDVNFEMLKLYREGYEFKISKTKYDDSHRITANSAQPQYLSIPFLEYSILVEGATDRLIYEYVLSDLDLISNVEYSFISSSGKDSICNPEKIAVDVNTPYSIIFDFDILKNQNVEYLDRLIVMQSNLNLFRQAIELSEYLKGIENIKNRGINALNGNVKEEYEKLLSDFKEIGIFIVPYGTLESWLAIESEKKDYPEKFISNYEERKDECENMHNFLNEVASHHQA